MNIRHGYLIWTTVHPLFQFLAQLPEFFLQVRYFVQ